MINLSHELHIGTNVQHIPQKSIYTCKPRTFFLKIPVKNAKIFASTRKKVSWCPNSSPHFKAWLAQVSSKQSFVSFQSPTNFNFMECFELKQI